MASGSRKMSCSSSRIASWPGGGGLGLEISALIADSHRLALCTLYEEVLRMQREHMNERIEFGRDVCLLCSPKV